MINTKLLLSIALTIIGIAQYLDAQAPIARKFEYKHSFRSPKLAQPDGTIPFWDVIGDAIASSEQLRLVPSMRSRKGAVWNKKPFVEDNWEVEMTIKVTGQGRIGADGLALWYTAQKGVIGPVFGSNDYWTGMGLLFDSFDNDNQRNNPYIGMMINDGTRAYDHQSDGGGQFAGGCQRDFRNRVFPVKAKITYYKNILTVLVSDGMTQEDRYELCLRTENIFLPRNGYFGISAATGGLADDHDVLAFSAYSLRTETAPPAQQMPQQEKQKFDEEFEKMWQEFEQEKDKFKKEHPDKVKKDDDLEEYAKNFEDTTARELRLIYETQNAIHLVMQNLDNKMSSVLQNQNQHTPLLQQAARNTGGQVVQTGGQQQQVGGAPMDTFQRHEVNEIMQLTRALSQTMKEVKQYSSDVYSRVYSLESKINSLPQQQQGQGVGSVQQAGGVDQQVLTGIRNNMDMIKQDIQHLRTAQTNAARPGAPAFSTDCNCTSTTLFIAVALIQSIAIIGFVFVRSKQDKAKFY